MTQVTIGCDDLLIDVNVHNYWYDCGYFPLLFDLALPSGRFARCQFLFVILYRLLGRRLNWYNNNGMSACFFLKKFTLSFHCD